MRSEHDSKTRRLWLIAAAALTLPLLAWTHDAHDQPLIREAIGWRAAAMHGPMMSGRFRDQLAERVGLSQEQRDVIRDLVERARPTAEALRDEMHANRTLLMDTAADDADYADVVARVAESNGRIVSALIRNRAQLRAEIAAVLTPDQRERARALRTEIRTAVEQRIHDRLGLASDLPF